MNEFQQNRKKLVEGIKKKSATTLEEFLAELDAEDDEQKVREWLAAKRYSPRHIPWAKEWLRRKEEARTSEASARAEARDTESLSTANRALAAATEANHIASENLAAARDSAASARLQARWAMWAAVIAVIAAIVAMYKA